MRCLRRATGRGTEVSDGLAQSRRDGRCRSARAKSAANEAASAASRVANDFGCWAWPDGVDRHGPDTCEIGYTWLSPAAIRTGANTEMKRLMLTHAFEAWQVQSVCLHTDARNERSRQAMERIGAHFEGILRAHRLGTDLRPRDSARFSVTAAEWPSVRQHLEELATRYG
jgi:RimJ/RimL family protein N-acetyltransferase